MKPARAVLSLIPVLFAVAGCDDAASYPSGERGSAATDRGADPASGEAAQPPRKPDLEPEPLRVSVARSAGELYLRLVTPDGEDEEHRVPGSPNVDAIAAVLPDAPAEDAAVVMETGRDVAHEEIVAITDALRRSGWTRVSMRMAPVQ